MTQNTKQILLGIIALLILIVGVAYARDPDGVVKAFREGFNTTSGSSKP
ncbi:MAG: hypothetical protein M3P00_03275 [Gemmatimonadota bacterium]|nr:hypothetical protein [Gemmatimonadota bacterium]